MSRTAAPPAATHGVLRTALVALIALVVAIGGVVACASASSPLPSDVGVARGVPDGTDAPIGRVAAASDDGALPEGTTAFDVEHRGIADLDPDLLEALRRATADAAAQGVDLRVNSGWRSPGHQERLLREAVAEHGSAEEAARWVATPERSPHVSGDAVDVGPAGAADWLSENSATYGLCRIYGNEPWHFELRPEAVGGRCPRPYPDPTHDPRMQD